MLKISFDFMIRQGLIYFKCTQININERIVRNAILIKPISIQNFIINWLVINLYDLDKQIKLSKTTIVRKFFLRKLLYCLLGNNNLLIKTCLHISMCWYVMFHKLGDCFINNATTYETFYYTERFT